MSRLDELPPDQRAALSLLLRQRKSYAEVAALLDIPERAVHDRAQAALAVLAPRQARELTAEQRESIGDYLLGQQPGVAERLATRTSLESSSGRHDVGARHRRADRSAEQRSAGRDPRGRDSLLELSAMCSTSPPRAHPRAESAPRPGGAAAARSAAELSARWSDPARGHRRACGGGCRAAHRRRLAARTRPPPARALRDRRDVHRHRIRERRGRHENERRHRRHGDRNGPKRSQATYAHGARPGEQSRRRRGDPLRRKQARLLHRSRTPAPEQRLLLRDLALQLAHQRARPLSKSPAGRLDPHARRRRAAARATPANYHEMLLTRETSHRPSHPGRVVLQRAVQPRLTLARSLPGFMIPAGSSSAFSARSAARPPLAHLLLPSTARGRARPRGGG